MIALIGNPFSPDYARARREGPADALSFCSMNVALYGAAKSAWALDERPIGARAREENSVSIGRSQLGWEGDRLVATLDESTTPLTPISRPIRGKIVLHPEVQTGLSLQIDQHGQHRWWPVAPLARIEVDLPQPGVRFSGHGYYDANAGAVPVESTFDRWSWSRARAADGAIMTYDVADTTGAARTLAFRVSSRGEVEDIGPVWSTSLRPTLWGLSRTACVDFGERGTVARSLEDGPFYSRALIETRLDGQRVQAMHESLAAHRLRQRWVQSLVKYRMRTVARSRFYFLTNR